MKRLLILPAVVLAVALVATLGATAESEKPARDPGWKDGYRGAESCRPCHAKEYAEWLNSAHAKSTRRATAETLPKEIVAGGEIAHGPNTSRFRREGDTFYIETMGPDGELASYPITHVVGPVRMHMYLTRMDNGRLQVLPILKDLPANEFFDYTDLIFGVPGAEHMNAPRVNPGEPSFWTGPIRAYDATCGRCHTSGRGTVIEMDDGSGPRIEWGPLPIDCEACHGPCADHNEYWEKPRDVLTGEPLLSYWDMDRHTQQSMCLWCHMEGEVISGDWRPGDDVFEFITPTLLNEPERLDAAGRPRELVYDGLPFLFSRCAEEGGLTCISCHDAHGSPHGSDLLTPTERTFTLCQKCHQTIAANAGAHSHHDMAKSGGRCVSCHMPFLSIERGHGHVRDHTIGSPHPDLPGTEAATDACTWCHTGGRGAPDDAPKLEPEAIRKAFTEWYPGAKPRPGWVAAIAAGRERSGDAALPLAAAARDRRNPRLVRASAAKLLARYPAEAELYIIDLLSDEDSLVRRSAAWALSSVRTADADAALESALEDPSLAVRGAAARAALFGWTRVQANRDLLLAILPVLEEETRMRPRDDQRWFRLGAARQIAGDAKGAIEAYERKLALDPYAANVRRAV
ncbi:MAG: cytochrome c3 family protein, partial [Planctomycetota bacterium]